MAVFFNALSAVLVLLLLMSVGYFMGVKGWMTGREKAFLSKYIINIAVPFNCLSGLLNNLDRSSLTHAALQVFAAALGVACTMLLGVALARLLRLPREQRGVFAAMVGLSNTLFIGLPLSTQLFGEVCLPYVMLYYLANTMFTQSVGVMLIERSGRGGGGRRGAAAFLRSVFTKPPVIGLLVSVSLLALDVRPPEVIMRFSGYISGSVSPMALIYCGFIVYEVGLKNLRLARGLPTMLVMRLAAAPVICALLCRAFGITGLTHDVFVVESALPVVSQVAVMAGAYGADEHYAATGAVLSTLGCFFTIPVLMVLLGG